MSSCDAKTGVCETTSMPQGHCDQQGVSGMKAECKCGCGGACGGDPMVCKMKMWMCSFHEAKKAVMVEILKGKIQKAWGPKLEKEATAVFEAMEAKWKSMQAEGQAKEQLREKFEQICKESR